MIRDITIGQYYAKESPIHKLDPRTKFIATFVYMISMFCFQRFLGFFTCVLFLAMVIAISKIPFSHIVKGLKPIAMILIFTMCIQAVSYTHLRAHET